MGLVLVLLLVSSAVVVRGNVRDLGEEDWEVILKGEWMVKFYAPWCPACKSMKGPWEEFGRWEKDLDLDGVGQVDVTKSPGLSGRFLITSLPTIFHVKDGEFRQYNGPRTKDGLIDHVQGGQWKDDSVLPSWKNPGSPQMAVVALFFKLSMNLRNVHTYLTQDLQLPSWAVYVIFASVTILTGAFLGLVLVLCIDCVLPFVLGRKTDRRVSPQDRRGGKEKDSDDDDDDDADAIRDPSGGDEKNEAAVVKPSAAPSGGVRSRKPRKDDSS